MNVLAWNYRGLGNPRTFRDLCSLVRLHHPKIVFLSDTRMSDSRSRNLRFKLGYRNSLGISGGLVLFWGESIKLSLLSQGERYFDVLVEDGSDGGPWRATFIYGEPRVENRPDMWERMRTLCGEWLGPWMLIGDFNEAMWQYEHFSQCPRPEKQMLDFREVLSHCDLHDIGFSGLPWTYNNNQEGSKNVRVRLDRGVANSEWIYRFSDTSVTHLSSSQSDHKVLLSTHGGNRQDRPRKIFRYEIMWEREVELGIVIEKAWLKRNPGSDLGALASGLKVVTENLKCWSRANFGHVERQLESLRSTLENLEREDPLRNHEAILETRRELDELLYREEMMWLQRSRITWLKEGDRNTKYFHKQARWCARKNCIKKLKKDDGSWCTDQKEMREMATSYFSSMFLKDELVDPTTGVVDLFESVISDEVNAAVIKPYSSEEIGDALFQIGPLKEAGARWFSSPNFSKELGSA